jgi:hypothetical protein
MDEETPRVPEDQAEVDGEAIEDGGAGSSDVVGEPTDDVFAALGPLTDVTRDRISALEERRRELAAQRKVVLKDLKNEQRRNRRLFEKAKVLSNDELISIIASRQAAVAKAKAKSKAKERAAAAAKAKAEP